MSLRAAAYTGFRLPTLNGLYRPFTVFPVLTQANAGLETEKLKGVEAGFDLRPAEDVTIGATAFYNRLDDAIPNVTISPDLRLRHNVEAVISMVYEFTSQAQLADFFLLAYYAYTSAEPTSELHY